MGCGGSIKSDFLALLIGAGSVQQNFNHCHHPSLRLSSYRSRTLRQVHHCIRVAVTVCGVYTGTCSSRRLQNRGNAPFLELLLESLDALRLLYNHSLQLCRIFWHLQSRFLHAGFCKQLSSTHPVKDSGPSFALCWHAHKKEARRLGGFLGGFLDSAQMCTHQDALVHLYFTKTNSTPKLRSLVGETHFNTPLLKLPALYQTPRRRRTIRRISRVVRHARGLRCTNNLTCPALQPEQVISPLLSRVAKASQLRVNVGLVELLIIQGCLNLAKTTKIHRTWSIGRSVDRSVATHVTHATHTLTTRTESTPSSPRQAGPEARSPGVTCMTDKHNHTTTHHHEAAPRGGFGTGSLGASYLHENDFKLPISKGAQDHFLELCDALAVCINEFVANLRKQCVNVLVR